MKAFSFILRTALIVSGLIWQIKRDYAQAAMCFSLACYLKVTEPK